MPTVPSPSSGDGDKPGPLATVLALSRALLLDLHWRRQMMVYLIAVAFGMMIVGGTVGFDFLRERVPLFLAYWCVCAFLTLVAALLALYDLLVLRLVARRAQRELHERLLAETEAHRQREKPLSATPPRTTTTTDAD